MLTLNSVSKSFANQKVFDNISMTMTQGHILGLAGPSGSGKSTLLRCIQKLDKVDSGSIDCQVSTGFMFQDFQLFPHMTVLENLVYAPSLKDKTSDHEAKALHLLQTLGLKQKANHYPSQLSGGQKQRAALARSLMMSPQLLLCDEPTSGLDVATIIEVVNLLKSVQAMGISMIIASHDLDFLTKIADKILVLKDGTLRAEVDPKALAEPINYLKSFYSEE